MRTRINPWPFCGASSADPDAICQEYATIEPKAVGGALRVNMDGFGWYWVMCGNCMAQGPKYHGGTNFDRGNTGPKNFRRCPEKTAKAIIIAVEAWNRRTAPTLFDMEVTS